MGGRKSARKESRKTVSGGRGMWVAIPRVQEVSLSGISRSRRWGEASGREGRGGCHKRPPRRCSPAQVGWSRLARGLLQRAGGVGPGFLGKSPPSAGMGLSGCPLPARSGDLGPRSSRDPGIAGRPDGNPAFDRDCREGLSPWLQEGGGTEPSAGLPRGSTPALHSVGPSAAPILSP